MPKSNLRTIDLNLLLALEALLEERNVTRAAERVHLSQPAMSRALGRLRDIFSDPLLVKSGRELLPTPRAARLQHELYQVLSSVKHLVNWSTTPSEQSRGHVRMSAPDGVIVSFLGSVIRALVEQAPNIQFSILHQTAEDLEDLRHGRLDLALGYYPSMPRDLHSTSLLTDDRFSCLVRKNHPAFKRRLTRAGFLAATHVEVFSPTGEAIERRLEFKRIHRKVSVRVASFVSASAIIAQTDWIVTVPTIFALHAPSMFPVRRLDFPISMRGVQEAPVQLFMVWHDRCHSDALQQWLRSVLHSYVSNAY